MAMMILQTVCLIISVLSSLWDNYGTKYGVMKGQLNIVERHPFSRRGGIFGSILSQYTQYTAWMIIPLKMGV